METIIKDLCYRELQLAVEACDEYIPLTAMQYYIEADEDPNIAEIKAKNETVKTDAFGHIKKALEAIRLAIGSLLKKLANVFSKASMEKQTKEAWEAYQRACKENPSLADMKISATDFKESEKVYQKILKETEEAEKEIVAGRHVDVSALAKRFEGYLSEVSKGAATAVGAQTLLNIARSNQGMASLITFTLNHDANIVEGLEKQIGKANTDDLREEVAMLTNRCALYRLRLKWHGRMAKGIDDSFTNAIKGLKDAVIPSTNIKDAARKQFRGNAKETEKFLRGNETVARTLDAKDNAVKAYIKDAMITSPIENAKLKHKIKAEARREARGDYSGADVTRYVKHNIDRLRNKR